jgi:acyl-CoA synthetase (AMP-forming)/AMP-acid ligase II
VSIWRSNYPDVDVGGATLPSIVDKAIERHPGRTALVEGESGKAVTYAEFGHRVERISAWLARRGVEQGSTIALWAPNTPPWAAFALATMRLGATVTAMNPQWTADEAERQLNDAKAEIVVTTPTLANLSGARQVIVLGEHNLATMLANEYPAPPPATDHDAVALLPYSSGTTGFPKGVQLTHTNLVTTVRQVQAVLRVGDNDTVLALAPFFHVLGGIVTLLVPLAAGATVVTVPRFDPALVLDLIEQHRITFTAVPPPVAGFLAHHPSVAGRDLTSLQLLAVGGAPLPVHLQKAVAARLPRCVVAQGWGLTETTSSVCVPDRADPAPPGTVGRLLPNTELTVVDPDTGRPAAVGELCVRGPQVMAGYLNEPAATAEILDADGWLHTGDLGRVDNDGNVVVLDRLKDLIKVDGFQVAPAELESLLMTHPVIADAAVVGRPDERHGERPVAYVVAKGPFDPGAITDWLAARTTAYKHLAEVIAVGTLPRTPSGKLQRRYLRYR